MSEPEKIHELYIELINSNFHIIPSKGVIDVCCNQGVYIVYNNLDTVLHVGKTNGAKSGINQRLLNHVRNQSSFSKIYMQQNKISLRNGAKFKYIEVECARERALLEALTAGLLCPAHIGVGVKKIKNH